MERTFFRLGLIVQGGDARSSRFVIMGVWGRGITPTKRDFTLVLRGVPVHDR